MSFFRSYFYLLSSRTVKRFFSWSEWRPSLSIEILLSQPYKHHYLICKTLVYTLDHVELNMRLSLSFWPNHQTIMTKQCATWDIQKSIWLLSDMQLHQMRDYYWREKYWHEWKMNEATNEEFQSLCMCATLFDEFLCFSKLFWKRLDPSLPDSIDCDAPWRSVACLPGCN